MNIDTNQMDVIGELFVYENFPELFRLPVAKCEWNTAIEERPKAAGADLEAWLIINKENRDREWMDPAVKGIVGEGQLFQFEKIIKGPIEVKASSFEQYTARNDFSEENGVLPFAIWNSNNFFPPEPKRKRLGSLYRMFYPKNAEHERAPLAYCAVFFNRERKPYACLNFENFPMLKERLIKIGNSLGLDLTEEGFMNIPCLDRLNGWDSPDQWADQKMRENPGLWLKDNMWYVRMSDVIDLATVTLIGDLPEIEDGYNRCSGRLQKSRLEYLKQHSRKTIPLVPGAETKEEIRRRSDVFELALKFFPQLEEGTGQGDVGVYVRS